MFAHCWRIKKSLISYSHVFGWYAFCSQNCPDSCHGNTYRFSTKFHAQSHWACCVYLTNDCCYPEEQINTTRTQILTHAFYKCSAKKQKYKGDFAIAVMLFRHLSITEWKSEVPSDCLGILLSLGITGFCLTATCTLP